jgi:hypothetical protein
MNRVTDHAWCYEQDYGWLVPRVACLHRLYHFTERHGWAYGLTKPLWAARYYWRSRAVLGA